MIEKIISVDWQISSVLSDQREWSKVSNLKTFVPPEIEKYCAELKPHPNCSYVHVIAMTDSGKYGSNLNGDVFREDMLLGKQAAHEAAKNPGKNRGVQLPRFKTFEDAKFFRHHANSPTDPFFGDVPLAAWNEVMKRVELIIRIFKKPMAGMGPMCAGAPDIIAKLDSRGFITVSMGCRIGFERCLYCGHEHEQISQRCDCLKNHMNEIMPNGELVAADNEEARFFDISDVAIPADVLAYSLGKVASHIAKRAERTVNMAKDTIEIVAPWRTKAAEMEKRVPHEQTCGQMGTLGAAFTDEKPKPISSEKMKCAFAAADSLDTFISTATLMGIVLSPEELAEVTCLDHARKQASTEVFDGVGKISLANFSPYVFQELKDLVPERSGYATACLSSGWEPGKYAAAGHVEASDYYAFYRRLLADIPVEGFKRAAFRNPMVRELLGNTERDQYTRVSSAVCHLGNAGLSNA